MALFRQLLKLHKGNIPLEDFFTEIAAYLLSTKKEILFSWLKYSHILDLGDCLEACITTQKTFNHPITGDEKRPDIVIELANGDSHDVIFIESKIGSHEGYQQLSDYAEILNSLPGYRQKLLIYITRDFDPKQESAVLEHISNPEVKFKQLRWHQFYQFLSTQGSSELIQEVTQFMQEYRMAQNNQFSSIDVLALANFPTSLKLMEEVMWGKVFCKFQEVLGHYKSLQFRKRRALQNIQWHGRYVMGAWMPDKWLCWLGFDLKTLNSFEYPVVRIVLEIDPKSPHRNKIIKEFKDICTQFSWRGYELDKPNIWSHIAIERSLRSFLVEEDHVVAIENFFLDGLGQLQIIKNQYPQLPWGTVPEEDEDSPEN